MKRLSFKEVLKLVPGEKLLLKGFRGMNEALDKKDCLTYVVGEEVGERCWPKESRSRSYLKECDVWYHARVKKSSGHGWIECFTLINHAEERSVMWDEVYLLSEIEYEWLFVAMGA
jgi:hypothetical protein